MPPRDPPPISDVSPGTFIFADIAGLTALTEAHGDEGRGRAVVGALSAVKSLAAASVFGVSVRPGAGRRRL